MIIDQSVGKCDQGNKPKHVILPSLNKVRKCLSFEKVREKKSTLFHCTRFTFTLIIYKLLITPIIQFQLIQVSCLLSPAGNLFSLSIMCMFIVKSQINLNYY